MLPTAVRQRRVLGILEYLRSVGVRGRGCRVPGPRRTKRRRPARGRGSLRGPRGPPSGSPTPPSARSCSSLPLPGSVSSYCRGWPATSSSAHSGSFWACSPCSSRTGCSSQPRRGGDCTGGPDSVNMTNARRGNGRRWAPGEPPFTTCRSHRVVAAASQTVMSTHATPVAKMPKGMARGRGGSGMRGPDAMHPARSWSNIEKKAPAPTRMSPSRICVERSATIPEPQCPRRGKAVPAGLGSGLYREPLSEA